MPAADVGSLVRRLAEHDAEIDPAQDPTEIHRANVELARRVLGRCADRD